MNTFANRFVTGLAMMIACVLSVIAQDSVVLPERIFPELNSILQTALKQSPQMIARNLDREMAEGERVVARAGLLPSVSGYYQISQTQDDRADQATTLKTNKVAYNLALAQPIFHWKERKNAARIGVLRKQIADGQFAEAYRGLAQEIRSSYMLLISTKIIRANGINKAAISDRELKLAEDKVAQKVATEADIFQIRIANEQNHLNLEYTELEYLRLKQSFARLTGMAQLKDEEIPNEIQGLGSSKAGVDRLLADFLNRGEPTTTQVLILKKQIEAEDLVYRNQRKRLLPKFNLVAGFSQDEQDYTANPEIKYGVQSTYVGLQGTWTIFDGFATGGAIRSSLARKRQFEAAYKEVTEALAQDAQRAAKQVELAYRQMQINDRLLVSADEFYKFRQADFNRGVASETDVSAAEANYKNMFANAIGARYNFLMRNVEFVSLVGQDPALSGIAQASN